MLQRKVFKKTKLGHWLCEKETGTLPDSVAAELKMYSKAGAFPVSVVSGNITVTTLTGLNDTLKWNLKQIAEFIRRHPHWFFTEAA